MKIQSFRLLALGLVAILAGCASPTNSTPAPAPTPKTSFFLFATAGTPDILSTNDDWGSGTTIDRAFADTTYSPVVKLTSVPGWGSNVAAIGFNNIAPRGTLLQYTTLQFKVKASGYTTVKVKFPAAATPEVTYTLAKGTSLAGGWTQMNVPFADFGAFGVTENQVGIYEFGVGSLLVTDVGFTGTAAVNTAALTAAITTAQALKAGTTVGTGDGNVTQAGQDAFAAAIATAQAAPVTTWAQINTALASLDTATAAFNAAVIHFSPSTLAPAPTLAAGSVLSLYNSSATYTNVTGITWSPGWGQTGTISDATVAGKTVKKLSLQLPNNYQGVDFSSNVQDVTGKTKLHLSYWTRNGAPLKVYAINAAGTGYAADTNAGVASGALTSDAWTDLEIVLPTGFHPNIQQLKFDTGTGEFFLDNIYFH